MHPTEFKEAAEKLEKSGIIKTTPSSLSNFEALFDFLATEFKDTRYIGGQTCYDTALCVGAFYAKIIEPEKYVYIMSSPVIIAFRELIKHKMIPNARIKKLMPRPQGDVPYIVCEYHVLMTFLDDLYNKKLSKDPACAKLNHRLTASEIEDLFVSYWISMEKK